MLLHIYFVSVGDNTLQATQVTQSDYFFQVTKVMHYFYKKISELLFQISNTGYFIFLFSH